MLNYIEKETIEISVEDSYGDSVTFYQGSKDSLVYEDTSKRVALALNIINELDNSDLEALQEVSELLEVHVLSYV